MKRAASAMSVQPLVVAEAPATLSVPKKYGRLVLQARDHDRSVLAVHEIHVRGELAALDVIRRFPDGSEREELRIYRRHEVRAVEPVVCAMREQGAMLEEAIGAALWLEQLKAALARGNLHPLFVANAFG